MTDVYRFGRFALDADRRQLLADGQAVTLGARALDVLVALVERRNRVVAKDELLQLAWPGLVVEENNLAVQISALRKLLGTEAIATVAGRGYRFALALAGAQSPPADAAGTAPAPLSVAVLPFVNLGGDPGQDYFADGVTEDIVTELSRWRSLAVASRNSSFRFKGRTGDPAQVARELGVRFLVDGSIRRMGERVRINAQLTDAESGTNLWSERFDRPLADVFAVQDEVVQTIVGTLAGRVQASGTDRARRKPPASLDAYDLVLRGNSLNWDEPSGAGEARTLLERAIALDPTYGLAHSLLAVVMRREWENDPAAPDEALDRPLALARRGVELAVGESTCHTILGQIYLDRRQFDLALHHTGRGVEINRANQWNRADLGNVLAHVGRAEEGLALLREARRVDPFFGPGWYWRSLGIAQFVLHRDADALADAERGVASDALIGLALLAACCAMVGDAVRAKAVVGRCLAVRPQATVERLVAKVPFKDPRDSAHFAEALRRVGFPA